MLQLNSACSGKYGAADTLFWMVLSRLKGFGVKRRYQLEDALGSLSALATMSSDQWNAIGLTRAMIEALEAWRQNDVHHPDLARARQTLKRCLDLGFAVVTPDQPDFPEPLRHIHDSPLVLYARGDLKVLSRPQLAVVGSRRASRAGLTVAERFASELSRQGWLITSGLALGIDAAAHRGALSADAPTIAVIGSGVDCPYPRQNASLANQITHHGLILSEYPPGTPPRPAHFPQRNRIISGLSQGILVVEANLKSGSLITARLALEQGREVFAVPGSVLNPLSQGCHRLIREGAVLVESAAQLLEELPELECQREQALGEDPATREPRQSSVHSEMDKREIAVLRALGYDPVSTESLCDITGLSAEDLMQSLLLLQLDGWVDTVPGGYQRLR